MEAAVNHLAIAGYGWFQELAWRSTHMDVAKNRVGSNAGFAVHRSFAPTRIERELLAQVFEIIQHRTTPGDAEANRSNSARHQSPHSVIGHCLGEPSLDPPLVAREVAA
jgi:hypothetical protein